MYKERWDKAIQEFLKKHAGFFDGYRLDSNAESEELDKFVRSSDGQTALELLVVSLVGSIDLEGLDDSLEDYAFCSHTGGFALNCTGEDFISKEDYQPVSTREIVESSEVSAKEIIDYIVSELNAIADKVL
ncbi:MAG TPA: hypothetical protein VHQ41_02415 [Patescibacteria group bacterium]|jgi:hypothetical protein|nr:hypothetical protein [Patescibacteria group bacterium]